jgi:biopolymer transport protein ExbB
MFELVQSGGWLMFPIVICSIAAMAIVAERFWSLRPKRVVPENLNANIYQLYRHGKLDKNSIEVLRDSSPLGQVLAAGLTNMDNSREVMKESIEETGRHVVHDMERYLSPLGTVAQIAPLLGLLGTVVGMIKVFTVITAQGVGNPAVLAGGISEALVTTAAGLTVAIPTLICVRYFRRRIDDYVITMEQEALKLVLLLIFFMVSTTFKQEFEVGIDLPEATSESRLVDKPLEITIDAQGRFFVNQKQLVNTQSDTLRRALSKVAGDNRAMPVILSADAQTPHQAVITALDVAKQLGFSRLTFATQQETK